MVEGHSLVGPTEHVECICPTIIPGSVVRMNRHIQAENVFGESGIAVAQQVIAKPVDTGRCEAPVRPVRFMLAWAASSRTAINGYSRLAPLKVVANTLAERPVIEARMASRRTSASGVPSSASRSRAAASVARQHRCKAGTISSAVDESATKRSRASRPQSNVTSPFSAIWAMVWLAAECVIPA